MSSNQNSKENLVVITTVGTSVLMNVMKNEKLDRIDLVNDEMVLNYFRDSSIDESKKSAEINSLCTLHQEDSNLSFASTSRTKISLCTLHQEDSNRDIEV